MIIMINFACTIDTVHSRVYSIYACTVPQILDAMRPPANQPHPSFWKLIVVTLIGAAPLALQHIHVT